MSHNFRNYQAATRLVRDYDSHIAKIRKIINTADRRFMDEKLYQHRIKILRRYCQTKYYLKGEVKFLERLVISEDAEQALTEMGIKSERINGKLHI